MDDDSSRYSDDVLKAIDAGRKIEAIKLLREQTGLGLAEAKHEIDSLAGRRRPDVPPLVEEGGAGGLIKLIVVVVLLLAAYRFFVSDL